MSDIKPTESMTILSKALLLTFLIFAFFTQIHAQFREDHRELVKMNYERKYDRGVVLKHLRSDDPGTVNAALLTIANSGDTSFSEDVKTLNFDVHGLYTAFALGKTGSSEDAVFLTDKLLTVKDDNTAAAIYQAIGKTGSEQNLSRLIILFLENKLPNTSGFPLALLNFHLRKVTGPELRNTLIKIISESGYDTGLKAYAMMVLFRTGPRPEDEYMLQQYIIPSQPSDQWQVMLSQYALGCYIKLKTFPVSESIMLAILNTSLFEVQINGITAISNSMFDGDQKVKIYAEFMKSENKNVAIHAAANLKNLKFADSLTAKTAFETYISYMDKSESDPEFKGTLLESLMNLFPDRADELFNKYRDSVSMAALAGIISLSKNPDEKDLSMLIERYKDETPQGKIAIAEALVKLNSEKKLSKFFDNTLLKFLDSPLPYISGTIAAGIDSAFALSHAEEINIILISKSNSEVNNPDFYETFAVYLSLAGLTGGRLSGQLKEIYSTSVISSVRALGGGAAGEKNPALFDLFYNTAFKYGRAEITTTAGSFIVKLHPEFAPVTTGNFIYLAMTSYFSNLRFHRVVPGFVIQGGDPSGSGWGGPGYDLISEFSPLHYKPMMMGMASSGRDTEGSQWFITTGNYPHLNWNYTIFGEVLDGQDAVKATRQGDRIIKIVPLN